VGDLERLMVRVEQLSRMLPLQSRWVKVPYEATASGFQLFTPGANAIVPELIGFEGAAHIDGSSGKSTDLLVYGKHISIHETKVVAGGQFVSADGTSPGMNIVSRDVLRVKVPGEVKPTRILSYNEDGQPIETLYVELYLATPNGISNRLLVPYGKPDDPADAQGYRLSETFLNVAVVQKADGTNDSGTPLNLAKLQFALVKPQGATPDSLNVSFWFSAPQLPDPITIPALKASPTQVTDRPLYEIQSAGIADLATQMIRKLGGTSPPPPLVTSKIEIEPVIAGSALKARSQKPQTTNQLTIRFRAAP
jgi:hypothetical protein